MRNLPTVFLLSTLPLLNALPGPASSGPSDEADAKVLASVGLRCDSAALIAYFQGRTPTENSPRDIAQLVRQLGHEEFSKREEASRALRLWGPPALPALRQALDDPDPERNHRARECLEHIETGTGPLVPGAAARVLALRRPTEAVAVVLNFLPHADNEHVVEELCAALLQLSPSLDRLDPHVLACLEDPEPRRRAAVGYVVGRRGNEAQRRLVHRLLGDADPLVRFRTACALLLVRDRTALPALVSLLLDGPTDLVWQVEEVLITLAGDSAPAVSLNSAGAQERRRCRDAWADWYQRGVRDIDLTRYEESDQQMGMILGVEYNTNRVFEVSRAGILCWEVRNLGGPMEAEALPGGRVLIADSQSRTVSERDTQGTTWWEVKIDGEPTGVQRLANGNTFVSTCQSVMEFDRNGLQVCKFALPGDDRSNAIRKHKNGNVIYATDSAIVEVSPAGKKLRTVPLPRDGMWVGLCDLPGDRFLVSNSTSGRVLEVDRDGQILWQTKIAGACGIARGQNGTILVAANNRVVEVNRLGEVVWEIATPGYVRRVHRR
jgi:hypothetical protein